MGKYLIIFVLCLMPCLIFSQQTAKDSIATQKADSLSTELKGKGIVVEEVTYQKQINPLAPSKAAFLSAILPGLGQMYNKRYWKAPLVWGALGTSIAVYSFNNTQYNSFRDEFKLRQAGLEGDTRFDALDNGDLEDAQNRFQEQRDLALLVTILLYTLNVVDANVDAHLKQFNVDDRLSMDFKPFLDYNQITAQPNYGMALVIKF
ncbi:DUF5683 domain-containing protein [Croceitalea marina]|uniref:DUF5683 domain-containing protein n=1 Tax=Croceitalea marina TaxID=1775166 RepID=A0ABW5MY94_9FLAO